MALYFVSAFSEEETEEPRLTTLTKQHKNAIRALRKIGQWEDTYAIDAFFPSL
ncbi:hypothetical protein TNCV_3239951 [Trichonephila clavipes]|nr:hypothetical protein TNCV_3239951 [Trichonephila clavipes]